MFIFNIEHFFHHTNHYHIAKSNINNIIFQHQIIIILPHYMNFLLSHNINFILPPNIIIILPPYYHIALSNHFHIAKSNLYHISPYHSAFIYIYHCPFFLIFQRISIRPPENYLLEKIFFGLNFIPEVVSGRKILFPQPILRKL